ncbi:hypothetical protein GCM10011380_17250 [Sphingomonas metalli]|uniref:Cellulose-binding protein n=1 Tax=Sphingomonas metalli TaxID=1779358 RepID=A0A916T2I9_9SPHN|nr:hypothetical protein [Sphingomonas metalli]GGB28197.1 hypothetical protein GCM10011380_17250 [Sphingomonas metalli]
MIRARRPLPRLLLAAAPLLVAGLATAAPPAPRRTAAAPGRPADWRLCANEGGQCRIGGRARVRYGAAGKWSEKLVTGSIACGNGGFGDPAFGTPKHCETTAATIIDPPAAATPVPPPVRPSKPVVAAGPRAWPLAAKPTTRRAQLGINIAGPGAWWSGDQTYVNLLRGAEWRAPGWANAKREDLGPDGIPKAELISAAYQPLVIIKPPLGSQTQAVPVVCTWAGKGRVTIGGNSAAGVVERRGRYEMTFVPNRDMTKMTWLQIMASDRADPIRNLDCRAAAHVGLTDLFLPEVVAYYRNFGTLRFLDASGVNGNGQWRWTTRTQPDDLTLSGSDGMPLEHQVALAAAAQADGWYNVSYNADEDYQRRMAQLIHDATPADRHVYVELSNEVWNFAFAAAAQANREGAAVNLSSDGDAFKSGLFQYARRTAELMRIWTDVFRDRPGQLIRVAATQQDNPWTANVVLRESGLGRSGLIDALAVAPYFGAAVIPANPGVTDPDRLFPLLRADMVRILTGIQPQNRAVAKEFGLRLISYEGGQHIVADNVDVVAGLNRDPRMGALYADYIPQAIAANDDDLLVLFSATGPIGKFGAWGLREYAGQPRSEAPKLDAVLTALGH